MQHSVWATTHLNRESEERLRRFFNAVLGIPNNMIKRDLHVTIYHARRNLRRLTDSSEEFRFNIPASELRMMAMAPGGENPRPDIDPIKCMIGLRIRRANGACAPIENLRQRFYEHETSEVLGIRRPSNRLRSAFGAHHFQPHISVLKPGAVSDPDLSKLGMILRESIDQLSFDRFLVRCRTR
jgi:hypothetical protein